MVLTLMKAKGDNEAVNVLVQYFAAPARRGVVRNGNASPVLVYWALFAGSASMFIAQFMLGGAWPALAVVLSLASSVTCGFAWLLARSLFKPNPRFETWPIALVASLFAMVFLLKVASLFGWRDLTAFKLLGAIASLLSSAVLVLTLVEAIDGVSRETTGSERRFRLLFLAGNASLVFVGVALFRSSLDVPDLEVWEGAIQACCALLALAGGTAAARYRLATPLTQTAAPRRRARTDRDQPDEELTRRIQGLLAEQHLYRDPEVKIGRFAERLGEPEYKVSRCVTAGLGFANFNQLINRHRIDDAKRRLSDRAFDDHSILMIAMDSGFASIGPFNRTFKAQVGMTPGAFRAQSKSGNEAG